jgi:hypothetical protein
MFGLFESRKVGAFIEELDTTTFHIMLKSHNLAIRRDKVIGCALWHQGRSFEMDSISIFNARPLAPALRDEFELLLVKIAVPRQRIG